MIRETRPTAVVIGAADERLRQAATQAAHDAGVPAYVSRRVSGASGLRLTALDVSDQIEHKLRALAAYPDRWAITDRAVSQPDGSLLAVTGTETYLRLEPPHPAARDLPPPTPLARLLAGAAALVVGAAFGLLGTIAHQSVLRLGPVTIPIGLVLSLVAVSALLIGLRLVLSDRIVILACAIGMIGTIFLLSPPEHGRLRARPGRPARDAVDDRPGPRRDVRARLAAAPGKALNRHRLDIRLLKGIRPL